MNHYFDEKGNPKTKLVVIGDREQVEIDALIDTGFNGSLMLPLSLAILLRLRLISSTPTTFADGTINYLAAS